MARVSAGRKQTKRTAARKRGGSAARQRLELGLIGIDVGGEPSRVRARALVPLMGIALLAALTLASLRIDLLRIRYAVAEANDRELALQTEQRALTADMRSLRDPVTLTRRADELGFVRPERMIDLPGDGGAPAASPDHTPVAPPSFVEEAVAVLADARAHTLRSWNRNP